MTKASTKVYFYIPSQELIENVPATVQEYWGWIDGFIKRSPVRRARGGLCRFSGPYTWTVQTFIYLRASGWPCELTASLPEEGIIIAHSDLWEKCFKPSLRQFVVEIKPDRALQCIFANFIIVQNRHDPVCKGIKRLLINSAFINNWPQPALLPRDSNRNDRFENICFMGNPEQFLAEADDLEREIRKLGLNWTMMPREKWHDYSEVDAIVAVRPPDSFRKGVSVNLSSDRKPATRLINTWLAGVPAVLSPDTAFEDIRESELDYLRAKEVPQIIEQLKRLMNDAMLRRAMVENGRKRAVEYTPERNVRRWSEIIQGQIMPEYLAWRKSPLKRKLFFSIRKLAYKINGIDVQID
jgi:hypothetical protein